MSKNIREIPATEIIERAGEIARIDIKDSDSRIWGALNDSYVRDFPNKTDWKFFIASSAIFTHRKYDTGNATINTGATLVTFGGGAALTTDMTGRRIKFNGNDNIYVLTVSNMGTATSTAGTLDYPLSEGRNLSSDAFSIFESFYALPSDFARFPHNGGLLLYQGGRPTQIPEQDFQDVVQDFTPTPQKPARCRVVTHGTSGLEHVELDPPPDKRYVLPYEYFQTPQPLRETTGGFAAIDAGSTTVVGSGGTTKFTEAQTGWYFRIDAFGDKAASEWYRIIAIAHDSSLTLQSAFGTSGATSAGYTICNAPAAPATVHMAVLWGTVKTLLADQNDQTFIYADSRETAVINDNKRLQRERVYNQELDLPMSEFQYRR